MLTKTIRILIADDHPIVSQGLVAILNDQPDMKVVAEATNGKEAIEQFRLHQPDVTLLDLRMPQVGGVEAIATIRSEFPNAAIIMFSIYETDEDIYQGLRAGAKAYLLKDTPCPEILEVIRAVNDGQRYVPAGIGTKLAARMERPNLSDREFEVLKLMAQGKNNKAISSELSITENTVKFHVTNVLLKLGASDRTHAVVNALQQGLIKL
ncbi:MULTISPECIES: response regulator [Leptolyngbya]|jgi:DNA-binding NarL/FixJ family response regulator|uniref:LuxR family two component transcriptional regulator n=1 Tax=Leptolyngbya boryana NIES-2135 TaxID=1973484 RepID=A0A1Z4JB47_LEPBY|nr:MULTISPECIES: response regulator transcription factor [Leptolyngbya]BAY53994.1 LuxR family two component transcriptional regulator [Leptolyngbya boryana NIES-2135]MBD1855969.1 response regulator transcription factor [Leptolyngbya sp. FACHB-1624]MBD2371527.1 response regulator transcription factor [Leptolyngbya sp. FACHB-161]MBD2378060.1 response regulator transcription factor [Leptolyngbya sp. FACHB-238]MBD2402466.1 response regulator transcription factor [Leptolyngbya sp. FACHB-239]